MRVALALLAVLGAGCSKHLRLHRPTAWNRAEVAALQSFHPDECATTDCITTGASCTRAHYQRVVHTTAGRPLIDDYFRVPSGAGCELIHFRDASADDDGQCEVTRQVCRGAIAGEHGKLDGIDCAPETGIYRAPDCH